MDEYALFDRVAFFSRLSRQARPIRARTKVQAVRPQALHY